MDIEKLWNKFETSGKIEDYLSYKLQNVEENEGLNEVIQGEGDSN